MVRVVVRSEVMEIDFHAEATSEFNAVTFAAAIIKSVSDLEKVMLFGQVTITLNKERQT